MSASSLRLIVHCGLHKTASTNLQHLLHEHRCNLQTRGVYYQTNHAFAAHHDVAWGLLAGDVLPLEALILEARKKGCNVAILSSEDLEGVLFRPDIAQLIEAAAAAGGASVEWHVVLREPGQSFASLYAQLQWHVYADALTLFTEIMNKGGLYMPDPAPRWGGVPYWYYSFDHERDLVGLEAATGQAPVVHDYADDQPYPGWRLLEVLKIRDLVTNMPGPMGQNRRHAPDVVHAGYRSRVIEAGGEALARHVDAAVAVSLDAVADCASLISERFIASHARALARFGVRENSTGATHRD